MILVVFVVLDAKAGNVYLQSITYVKFSSFN